MADQGEQTGKLPLTPDPGSSNLFSYRPKGRRTRADKLNLSVQNSVVFNATDKIHSVRVKHVAHGPIK